MCSFRFKKKVKTIANKEALVNNTRMEKLKKTQPVKQTEEVM